MNQPTLIHLKEWERREVELAAPEVESLQGIAHSAGLTIDLATKGRLGITASSIVGAISLPGLDLVIEPKLRTDRILFLLAYGRGLRLRDERAALRKKEGIVEAFAALFLASVERVVRRSLLQGYLTKDEAVAGLRGRLRFAEQIRRRHGLPIPLEVTYDDYSGDIAENRLLKAALRCLSAMRFRSTGVHQRVRRLLSSFELVSDVRYDRQRLPKISVTRLNERYRESLELARLVLQNSSPDLRSGSVRVPGFFFDMNKVFEDFVFAAIGDALTASSVPGERWLQGASLPLDERGLVRPEPDLSLWLHRHCVFVGDVKYKRTHQGEITDLYQLVAYCSASGLHQGLLVYASQTAGPSLHRVRHGGPDLRVEEISLELPRAALLARCAYLASLVRAMSQGGQSRGIAA